MMLISVIISTYNKPQFLNKVIEGLQFQSDQNFEIVIADDGSDSSTRDLIKLWQERSIVPVTHAWQEDLGFRVSESRNNAVRHSKGDYFVFIDGDDHIADNMIETLYLDITKIPAIQVAICNYESDRTDTSKDIERTEVLDREEAVSRLFFRSSYQGFLFNKMFKMEIIRKHNLRLDPQISICEDLLFCFQYFMYIEKAVYNSRVLYFYADTDTGATRTDRFNAKRYTMLDSLDEIEKYWELHPVSKKVKKHAYNYLATVCMLLFKMTVQYSEEAGKAPMGRILRELKKTEWKYLFSEWQLKFKVAYIPLKIISYFRKGS